MGQVLRQDKIGQLTHSAGNIIMSASTSNPAYLTIGGRQYTVTSNLSVALPSMSANTRYQVFAVQSGGVVSLAISLNENSVGPAGFFSWKLVGSLMSNGASPIAFGSFVNIKGAPKTLSIDAGPTVITGAVTNPTKGTIVLDSSSYIRDGDHMVFRLEFEQSAAGTNGSGSYFFRLPLNLTATPFGLMNNLTTNYGVFTGRLASGIDHYIGSVALFSTSQMFVYIQFQRETGSTQGAGIVGSATASLGVSGIQYGMNNVRIPIAGWSNTPIEDL